jgi:hypothetical protein
MRPQYPNINHGLLVFRSIDLDESEEAVKTAPGQIFHIIAININAALRYLKLYDASVDDTAVGTTTPKLTIPLPASTTNPIPLIIDTPMGIPFNTAITAAATTGVADNDTGAPSANDIIIQILYR